MQTLSRTSARRGFSLVELLVVIGIITLLAGILVVVIGQMGSKARVEATAATVRKVSNQVQERLEAADRQITQQKAQPLWKADIKRVQDYFATLSPPLTLNSEQASVVVKKIRIAAAFPQSFEEVQFLDTLMRTSEYARITALITNSSNHTPDTESAELLYFQLTRGNGFGIPSVDPGEFTTAQVADTDNDGLPEFVDAWGRPLRFYRNPTRLFRTGPASAIVRSPAVTNPPWLPLINGVPAAGTPDPLAKDQDDPTYQLSTLSATVVEQYFHTVSTYHQFLVLSSGPDGQKVGDSDAAFGLYAPSGTSGRQFSSGTAVNASTNFGYLAQPTGNFDALADNITNRNRP